MKEKTNIYCQVIDITKYNVIIRCLTDVDKSTFEVRQFSRSIINRNVRLGVFLKLRISEKPGEVMYKFSVTKKKELLEWFKPKDYLGEFANSELFKPLSSPLNIDSDES